MKKETLLDIHAEKDVIVLLEDAEDFLSLLNLPRQINDAVYILCLKGEASFKINLSEYTVRENDLITIPPGIIMQMNRRSADFSVYFVIYRYKIISNMNLIRTSLPYLQMVVENPLITLNEKEANWLRLFFQLLREKCQDEEVYDNPTFLHCMIMGLLNDTCLLYQRKIKQITEKTNRTVQIFKDLRQLIMTYYRTERTVNFYADKLSVSPKHLTATVKSLMGKTVSDLISEAVILDAKTQLCSNGKNVQQIAYSLNFPTASFFGKYFKRYTGMTPLEYRTKA